MDLPPATASRHVHLALDELLGVADRLGDAKVNERPISPHTNAVANLILHCCGVTEFWLGHVGLGRDSHRDRDSEFTRVATVAELHAAVEAARAQVDADLVALDAGATSPFAEGRAFLTGGDESDASRKERCRDLVVRRHGAGGGDAVGDEPTGGAARPPADH